MPDPKISTVATVDNDDDDHRSNQQDKERAIQTLLQILDANNIHIDEQLRLAVLGQEEADDKSKYQRASIRAGFSRRFSARQLKRESIWGALFRKNNSEIKASATEKEITAELREKSKYLGLSYDENCFECRITDGSYSVEIPVLREGDKSIPTVTNGGPGSNLITSMKRLISTGSCQRPTETKVVMKDVNLVFEEGKMYLILGAPGCGKSTLLKMIAGRLPEGGGQVVGGKVECNGVNMNDKDIVWSNIVSYVDQIERLHGFLTVKETIDFAFDCRCAGTHRSHFTKDNDPNVDEFIKKTDKERWLVDLIMRAVGIKRVADTFVGNASVRGVSGGEKKRVSVGEMLAARTWVECSDEISTGLDAATTYDICKILGETTRMRHTVRIVSLLQPPPETVALFDELILLGEGRILYAGPVDEVTQHFKSLGYEQPDRMDPADWLQSLPTKDGAKYLTNQDEMVHLTNEEFAQKFKDSKRGEEIRRKLQEPSEGVSLKDKPTLNEKYANSAWRSIKLLTRRELLLWWRDQTKRIARLVQCLMMGIIVGTVFWQTHDAQTRMGVNFQSIFFISLGAMLKVPPQIDSRAVFYKEQDACFYPTWTFVLGRALAVVPSSLQDTLIYGSIVYWFSGYAPFAANYFVFLLLCFLCAFTSNIMFSVFSAKVRDRPAALAAMSVIVVILILFSGFTVQPNVIPPYYIWIYWINLFAWIFRGIVINEFLSPTYDQVVDDVDGTTEGEEIMKRYGYTFHGEPFEFIWIWYTVLFCIGLCIVSVMITVRALETTRFESVGTSKVDVDDESESDVKTQMTQSQIDSIQIKGATLTFKNINYTVKASTSNEKLHLLKDISGYFSAGKLTALMGSSGAGKTTLMDVLSLRKTGGKVKGDVRVNGHTQEANTFRRMSGYVEQFDVQSPQLTIRETVEFSTKMRLDESIPVETKLKFSETILDMLELNSIGHLLVGSDTGGLSFEQRKRLSIAVELASNPSIIFLDEPTSGLDSRAASIVMKSLRRIADAGIAVVCTIHQPSVAIFNQFDSLLLLKRGGEMVFFGDLGIESYNLIQYLESYPTTTPIKGGENAATWMLTTIGAGSNAASAASFDYASAYAQSSLARGCLSNIDVMNDTFCLTECKKIEFPKKYSTSTKFQMIEVFKRLLKIYWRSPGYNRVRLFVSGIVALLFGSVFASQREPETEGDMNSRVTSIYITTLFLGVNAMNTVLPVFEVERNMFYRHKASLMYDYKAIALAFTLVEIPFIILASMVFVLLWYFTVGFAVEAGKFFLYWLFMFLSLAVFTFLGQGFMAIFPDSQTAQGFGSILIGMSGIFGGILIRPQFIPTFWMWAYWIFPLHYVLEGLLTSQFQGDNTTIVASFESPFYHFNNCTGTATCTGTAEGWIYNSFGGLWVPEQIPWDVLYLCGVILVARVMVLFGLWKKNYLVS